MSAPSYFDYAATTPVDPMVAKEMCACLSSPELFGNSASKSHQYGWLAEEAVEEARFQVADLVHCDPREIVWTSGATESDNLAIKGIATQYKNTNCHIITSTIEHKAVLDTCSYLAKQGYLITWLKPDSNGLIQPEQVQQALRPNSKLISLMHVNNEIGTVNNIHAIGSIARQAGVLLHSDAAQSCGKMAIDLNKLPVDLMSFSGHKMYGPKGIGVLFVRLGLAITCQIHGGQHERNMRSGTLPTHQIIGMGIAAKICQERMATESIRIQKLRQKLLLGLSDLEDIRFNGNQNQCIPSIINLSFPALAHPPASVRGDTLLMALAPHIAVSSGSACSSVKVEPSYVLQALGVNDATAFTSIRISIGRYTTDEDIDRAVIAIKKTVTRLNSRLQSV